MAIVAFYDSGLVQKSTINKQLNVHFVSCNSALYLIHCNYRELWSMGLPRQIFL